MASIVKIGLWDILFYLDKVSKCKLKTFNIFNRVKFKIRELFVENKTETIFEEK